MARALPPEVGIKALPIEGLAEFLNGLGEPSFRARQIVHWLYGRGATDYAQMSNVSRSLRDRLATLLPLAYPEVLERQVSADGTRKYLLRLADGASVETVGLPADDRLTVCFSTQVGCAMGCSFCATGQEGFVRDLGCGEMADQLSVVAADFGARVTNAVAMGQGEPFANYEHTLAALRIMNSPDGMGIGARHLTVSTCGILAGIRRFAEEPEQFTLAVSLHSAVQSTRSTLMPGVKTASLPELRRAVIDYTERTGRRVSLEYALVGGVNDSDAELAELIGYCRDLLVHVNLIPVNPTSGSARRGGERERAREFAAALTNAGIAVSTRAERGSDIDAACGQLKQRH